MSAESQAFVNHVKVKMAESAISLERAMAGLRKSAEESAMAFGALIEAR